MVIKNGNLADADDVYDLYGKFFKLYSQLLFNADLIGLDSDLDQEFDNLKYESTPTGGTGDIVDTPIFGANVLDDFEDASIDTDIWTASASGSATIAEANGSLNLTSGASNGNNVTALADQVNSINLNTDNLKVFTRYYYYLDTASVGQKGIIIYVRDESSNEVEISSQTGITGTEEGTIDLAFECDPTGNLINGVDVSALADGDDWHLKFYILSDAAHTASMKVYFVRWLDGSEDDITFISTETNSSETITTAIITANKTINGSSSAVYELSADGGTHWEVATLNEIHRFTDTGTSLMVKVTMTNDTSNNVYQLNHYAIAYNI